MLSNLIFKAIEFSQTPKFDISRKARFLTLVSNKNLILKVIQIEAGHYLLGNLTLFFKVLFICPLVEIPCIFHAIRIKRKSLRRSWTKYLEIFHVLLKLPFTASEMELDYYRQSENY